MNRGSEYAPLPGSKPSKPFDIIGFILRYGLLIVTLGMFLLVMLVPVVLKVKKPNYEVHSMLKIDPVVASLITKDDPSITGYYDDFVRTQAMRISEYDMVAEAMDSLSPEQRRTQCSDNMTREECVTLLQRIITISQVGGTHLVKLSIQGPKKEGLASVLNALMHTYLQKMQMELEKKDTRRLSYLVKKKNSLNEAIKTKQDQLQVVASTILSSEFSENFNVWQKRVEELQKSYIHFFGERVKAENEYKFEQKASEELKQLPLNALIDEGVMSDNAIAFTSSWTYQQLQELRSSIDGVTPENNDRKRVESRMDAMRDYEKKLRQETRNNLDSIIYGKQNLELQQKLITKENTYREALASEQDIVTALEEAEQASGRNSSAILSGSSLEMDLKHDRDLLFRIDTRIQELEIESRAPLRVTIESMAKEPTIPAGSNVKKLLMLCLAFSFGSVTVLFFLVEFFDNRVRTAKTVQHALGRPSTWPIAPAPDGVDFNSILTAASGSESAKAIRSLSTRIYREHEENQAKIFLFTAVDSRSGTSEITLNTAQALALQSSKVLVLDATLQGWSSGDAMEDNEETTFDPLQAVQHDRRRGFDYLVSFMPDRSSRYASRILNRFLREVKERYDFICIDSSPVLQSDLSEYLAAHSDAAILILQGDSTTYRNLRQSAEILVGLNIPALAPVLNWGGEKKQRWYEKNIDAFSILLRSYVQRMFPGVKKTGVQYEK